jgi:hypothetical protein
MSVWTDNPHLVEEIKALVQKGKSATFIARKIKVGRDLVRGKIVSMGFRHQGATEGTRAEAGVSAPSAPRRFSWEEKA